MTGTRPLPAPPRDYRFPAVEHSTLANGVRVSVAPLPRLPLVTVIAVVTAGSTQDGAGREGIAALTANALGEGTARVDGAALAEQFERIGTGFSSGADWDDASAHITVTPDRVEAAMALLGEVITAPAFREHDVERLKTERLADLLQQRMEPRGLAEEKFTEFLYTPGSRYALPSGGTSRSVAGLSAADARAFHAARSVPQNTTLIFAGDISTEQAVRLSERALGGWTGTPSLVLPLDDTTVNGRRVELVHKPDAPQTELRVGHRGIPRVHPDYFPVVVMNALLGGLFSSRINLNLREKNAFTYGASSGFDWRRGAGPFVVSSAVKTEVTGAAVREILAEIDRMRSENVAPDELTLATDYLDGVFPIRYETTQAVARAIAAASVFGLDAEYYTRYRERVRAVTIADVRHAAETYLHPDELLVVAVGDAKVIREPLEQLGVGAVRTHEPEVGA